MDSRIDGNIVTLSENDEILNEAVKINGPMAVDKNACVKVIKLIGTEIILQ